MLLLPESQSGELVELLDLAGPQDLVFVVLPHLTYVPVGEFPYGHLN